MANHDRPLLTQCCREASTVCGDAAEIGVYQGHGAELICSLLPESTVYLFDTFKGTPRETITTGKDGSYRGGEFSDTSEQLVRAMLGSHKNYQLVPGVFPGSASTVPSHVRLRFVHLDVDTYYGTLKGLEWAWSRLVPGGVLLDDDYACPSCPGAKAAVNEFCGTHGLTPEITKRRAIIRRVT